MSKIQFCLLAIIAISSAIYPTDYVNNYTNTGIDASCVNEYSQYDRKKKIFYHLREDEYYNTELKALKSVDFNIKYSIGRYENGPYDIEQDSASVVPMIGAIEQLEQATLWMKDIQFELDYYKLVPNMAFKNTLKKWDFGGTNVDTNIYGISRFAYNYPNLEYLRLFTVRIIQLISQNKFIGNKPSFKTSPTQLN